MQGSSTFGLKCDYKKGKIIQDNRGKIDRMRKMSVIPTLLAAGVILSAGRLFAYDLKEYFPLSEGDIWVYFLKVNSNGKETTGQEINKIKGVERFGSVEAKEMVSLKADNQCLAVDSEGVKSYKYYGWPNGDYEVYRPAKIIFPDIEPGKTVKYSLESVTYDIRDVEDESLREKGVLTVTLQAIEGVRVPAGSFKDCLKFVSVYEYKQVNKPRSGKETTTTWLARGIGRVKWQNIISEYDLVSKKEIKLVESFELRQAAVGAKEVPAGAARIIYHRDPPQ